jgi:hypothetical protein
MKMPKHVTLLSQRIIVTTEPNLHHQPEPTEWVHGEPDEQQHAHRAYGVYNEAEQSITLDRGLRFERARETFLHENLHAVLAISQIDSILSAESDGLSEHVVSAVAPVLLAWLRDNPHAVAWLQEVQS